MAAAKQQTTKQSKAAPLDKNKPHATVHGGDDNSDRMARFAQNGQLYDATGAHIGPDSSVGGQAKDEPDPEVDVTSGTGNLAKGQIPPFNKPLEEGGAGGGETKSYPQTTDKGQEVLDEAASDAAAADGGRKK